MTNHSYRGIKYPFTTKNDDNIFLDMNNNQDEELKSQLLHVILTPKGQRIRMPEFGTDVIRYIFDSNDSISWTDIKNDIQKNVSLYVPKANLINIEVLRKEDDGNGIFLALEYQVKRGGMVITEKIIQRI